MIVERSELQRGSLGEDGGADIGHEITSALRWETASPWYEDEEDDQYGRECGRKQ